VSAYDVITLRKEVERDYTIPVAGKLGLFASWMYSRRPHPALSMLLIESNCEEDIGVFERP